MIEKSAADKTRDHKYRVFISYSHKDRKWARWLHRALETYRPPRGVASKIPALQGLQRPLSPVFRDREELPSAASLSDAVNLALEESANLVVICSPAAAKSKWVNEEILTFKRLGRSGRIFCFIVDGEAHAADETGCFPEALRYHWLDDGLSDLPLEPLGADSRRTGDGRTLAKLKLIAGILDIDLDDLRQRDLQRRNKRLLAVTGGSVAVALLTISLAIMAFLSNAEAQRRRAQAEDLIGFMVGDLRERLYEIGRLDVFMSVGNKAMEYFSALPDEDVDGTVLNQRAAVLTQIGNTRLDQGELDAALESFLEARTIAIRLAKSDPSNTAWQITLANSHFWIGLVHWQQGELSAAGDVFQKVIPIVDRVERLEPGKPEWLIEKSYAYTNLARVLELQGKLEPSLDVYKDIAAINDILLAQEPENIEYRLEVGYAHNNIGKVVQSLGRLQEAEDHFKIDLEIKQAVSESDPNHNLWLSNLATSHVFLGRNFMVRGKYGEAHDAYTNAVRIISFLRKLDLDNTELSERLANYDRELGAVNIQQLRLKPAQVALDESSELWAELHQSDESKWSWRMGKGLTEVYQAQLALVEHDGKRALTFSTAARTVFAELQTQDPSNQESQKNLVLAGLIDGDAYAATGSVASATTIWHESLQLLNSLPIVDHPPELTELSAALHVRLGHDEQARLKLDELKTIGYQTQFVNLPDRTSVTAD